MISEVGLAAPVAAFIETFYKISDTQEVHQEYTEHFVEDPSRLKFQIGPMDPTNTRDGILAWRHKGWEGVTRRKHVVNAVFVSPERQNDIMLDGTVEMDKNGSTVRFHWAGRMVFDQSSLQSSRPLIESYKVWLVSTEVDKLAPSSFLTVGYTGSVLIRRLYTPGGRIRMLDPAFPPRPDWWYQKAATASYG